MLNYNSISKFEPQYEEFAKNPQIPKYLAKIPGLKFYLERITSQANSYSVMHNTVSHDFLFSLHTSRRFPRSQKPANSARIYPLNIHPDVLYVVHI